MYDSMTDTEDSRPSIYWFDEVESTMTKVSLIYRRIAKEEADISVTNSIESLSWDTFFG